MDSNQDIDVSLDSADNLMALVEQDPNYAQFIQCVDKAGNYNGQGDCIASLSTSGYNDDLLDLMF